MGGGGKSSGDSVQTTRYAPYIEEKHLSFLDTTYNTRQSIINTSPYADYEDQYPWDAMVGIGRSISEFPSLYDMFGKHMSGLDIESVWEACFTDRMDVAAVNGLAQAAAAATDEEIVSDVYPKYLFEMRSINAVNSTSFVIGKTHIELNRTRALAQLTSKTRIALLRDVSPLYSTFLTWEKSVVTRYGMIMKLYYETAETAVDANYIFAARDKYWPFEVLDFERANIGTMQGATVLSKSGLERKRSTISKAFLIASWGVQGATIGAQVGGYYGAAIGAAIGVVIGIAQVMWE